MLCSTISMAVRYLSRTTHDKACRLLIVGGGTSGVTMAAKFTPKMKEDQLIVIEPQENHYYQPLWTLVGAGLKRLDESKKSTSSVIPRNALWVKDALERFDPQNNCVYTKTGLKIPGLVEALNTPGVCSNYSFETVGKTTQALKDFKGGHAVFTQPSSLIKCAGAPQKILYLTDAYFRKVGKRDNANISFLSGMGAMFSVPIYAASLVQVAKKKNIEVQLKHNLVEVYPKKKEAVFEQTDTKKRILKKYDLLHVTPPMSPPEELKASPLVDSTGFLTVDKGTLQHTKHKNIFGIGDCTNLPTSKTAAAIAAQSGILKENIDAFMAGRPLTVKYHGYTSCPLLTNYGSCIMAEFDYDLKPLETFPFDQSRERMLPYYLKKDLMGPLYWNFMLKGYWNGPALLRKILRLGRT